MIYEISTAIYEFSKIKICVRFFRLWLRVCLACYAQSEFFDKPKCVERGIIPTFQRATPRLQTRKLRETRTDKLASGKLILGHSLNQWRNIVFLKNRKIANPKLSAPRPQTSLISRGTSPGRSYGTRVMPTRTPVTFEELFRSRSDRFALYYLVDFQFDHEYSQFTANRL